MLLRTLLAPHTTPDQPQGGFLSERFHMSLQHILSRPTVTVSHCQGMGGKHAQAAESHPRKYQAFV